MTVLLRHMLEEANDPWVKSWMNIQMDVGVITSYERKHVLVEAMADRAVKHVKKIIAVTHSTLEALPQPWKSFFFSTKCPSLGQARLFAKFGVVMPS